MSRKILSSIKTESPISSTGGGGTLRRYTPPISQTHDGTMLAVLRADNGSLRSPLICQSSHLAQQGMKASPSLNSSMRSSRSLPKAFTIRSRNASPSKLESLHEINWMRCFDEDGEIEIAFWIMRLLSFAEKSSLLIYKLSPRLMVERWNADTSCAEIRGSESNCERSFWLAQNRTCFI